MTKKEHYAKIAQEVGELLGQKNDAYGDSFERSADVMRMLYPKGISDQQMLDALCLVRIIDKLFRIATKKDAFGESPYKDIAGYAILGCFNHVRQESPNQAESQEPEGAGNAPVEDRTLQSLQSKDTRSVWVSGLGWFSNLAEAIRVDGSPDDDQEQPASSDQES